MKTNWLSNFSKPWQRALAVWIFLGFLAAGTTFVHKNLIPDDAFITFRYARNLSNGLGFVYNPGEFVLGTTTPFYTMLLAVLHSLSHIEISDLSLLVGGTSLWVGAGMLYHLGETHNPKLALSIAGIFITNPFLAQFIGMESYFLLGLLLTTNYAFLKRKLFWTAALGGLLVLVRYEMVIFLAIIAISDYITRRKLPLWLWPSAVPVLFWSAIAFSIFGSPIPLSASVKLTAPHIPFPVGAGVYLYKFVNEVPLFSIVGCFLLIGGIGFIVTRKMNENYRLISIFCLVYFGVATIFAGSFPWYYAPLTPFYAISAAYGIFFLSNAIGLIGDNLADKKIIAQAIQIVCFVILLTIQLLFWRTEYLSFDTRYKAYQNISNWILVHEPSAKSIAIYEIGYIGYLTNLKIIDLAGLVTPGLFPWVKDGAVQSLEHALELSSPDLVIIEFDSQNQTEILDGSHRYALRKNFDDRYLLYGKERTLTLHSNPIAQVVRPSLVPLLLIPHKK